MSDAQSITTKQKTLVALIGVVFVLLLVSLVFSGGQMTESQETDVDRDTCLQRGDVWSETNQKCYNSTAETIPRNKVS